MKFAFLIVSLCFAMQASASWRSESRKTIKEYKQDCQRTEVSIDSIVPNQFIKGHINGLPSEALDKFKVVFYVKTNFWYVHPYMYYQGQEEGYSYSNLNQQGEFQVKTVKRAVPSEKLAAVVVPKSYKIRSQKWWLKPALGFLGGVLKFQCASTLVQGNGDF